MLLHSPERKNSRVMHICHILSVLSCCPIAGYLYRCAFTCYTYNTTQYLYVFDEIMMSHIPCIYLYAYYVVQTYVYKLSISGASSISVYLCIIYVLYSTSQCSANYSVSIYAFTKSFHRPVILGTVLAVIACLISKTWRTWTLSHIAGFLAI